MINSCSKVSIKIPTQCCTCGTTNNSTNNNPNRTCSTTTTNSTNSSTNTSTDNSAFVITPPSTVVISILGFKIIFASSVLLCVLIFALNNFYFILILRNETIKKRFNQIFVTYADVRPAAPLTILSSRYFLLEASREDRSSFIDKKLEKNLSNFFKFFRNK